MIRPGHASCRQGTAVLFPTIVRVLLYFFQLLIEYCCTADKGSSICYVILDKAGAGGKIRGTPSVRFCTNHCT